jgi:succinate dehydrogenase/fumarate reductase-like Fe-S protein
MEQSANKEFNLSEKRETDDYNLGVYSETDVKEFIRLLKEKLKGDLHYNWTCQEIDKLAGEKLHD